LGVSLPLGTSRRQRGRSVKESRAIPLLAGSGSRHLADEWKENPSTAEDQKNNLERGREMGTVIRRLEVKDKKRSG